MPAIATALLTAGVTTVTTTLTERVVNGLLETDWTGTTEEWKRIEKKVMQCAVLGSEDNMKRTDYAASPILEHIKKFGQTGVANVAYVPPSMGKTTACHAIMKKYVKEGTNRGLCFSPNDTPRPYLEHMVTLLGFTNIESPPFGLVACLLRTLGVYCSVQHPSYLILDDFMPAGPNRIDIDLLLSIKTRIRSMNIIVVVLTASKDSADYMLTMNNLETITPPVGNAAMKIIRAEFQRGNHKRGDVTFHVKWETHLSMEWDAEEMRKAISVSPLYEAENAQDPQEFEKKIKTLLQDYSDEQRKEVTPTALMEALKESSRTMHPTITSSQSGTSLQSAPQETELFCSGCCVM